MPLPLIGAAALGAMGGAGAGGMLGGLGAVGGGLLASGAGSGLGNFLGGLFNSGPPGVGMPGSPLAGPPANLAGPPGFFSPGGGLEQMAHAYNPALKNVNAHPLAKLAMSSNFGVSSGGTSFGFGGMSNKSDSGYSDAIRQLFESLRNPMNAGGGGFNVEQTGSGGGGGSKGNETPIVPVVPQYTALPPLPTVGFGGGAF